MGKYSWVLFFALLSAQSSLSSIAGKWVWQGTAGWQRVVMDFKIQGAQLSGVIRMGPGGEEPKTSEDYWELFFAPTDFKILNGKIEGSLVYFEQEAELSGPLALGSGVLPLGTNLPLVSRDARPPQRLKFIYRGAIQGDSIVLTRETVSRNTDPWIVGNHKIQFALKRMRDRG